MFKKIILPEEIKSAILSKSPIKQGEQVQPLYVTDTRKNFDVAYVDSVSLTSFAETVFTRRLNWLSFFNNRDTKVSSGTYIVNLRFADGTCESCSLEYVTKVDGPVKEDAELNEILIQNDRRFRLESFVQIVFVFLLTLLFMLGMWSSFAYTYTECLSLLGSDNGILIPIVLGSLILMPVWLIFGDVFLYVLDVFVYPFRFVCFRK